MSRKRRSQHKTAKQPDATPTRASGFDMSRKWIVGLVLGVTFLAFFNTIFNGFAYDDQTQILNNELIRSFENIPTALTKEVWFWRVLQDKDPNLEAGPTTPYYRPVFTLYLMMGWAAFGQSPAGWHLLNVLMHVLVVYFAFLIVEKISGSTKLAALSALLFAVHPLRSESVAWISGVTDLFLAMFLLPAFYFYLLYREREKLKYLAASLAMFTLAAFSKEPAVAFPIFIVAYEALVLNRGKSLKEKIVSATLFGSGYLAISAGYFLMRYNALGFVLNDTKFASYRTVDVLMTIPIVICKYLGLLFWPVDLSLFHETVPVATPLSPRFYIPLVIVLAAAAGLWRLRDSTIARFAVLWFVINLLPVLNLSAFAWQFMVQERYVYIPSIGFSVLLGMALLKLPIEQWLAIGGRRTAQIAVFVLIVVLLCGKTIAQNLVWKDDTTLWTHGAETAPDQEMASYILGHHYLKIQRHDLAIDAFERYMQMDDKNLFVISNLATARLLMFEGTMERAHLDRAIALCEMGLKLNNELPTLWDTLGRAYTFDTELKNLERARVFFANGLKVQPRNPMINFHMGAAYVLDNKFQAALPYLEFASKEMPQHNDVNKFLAYAYQNLGQIQQAIDSLSLYLKNQPNARDAARENQRLQHMRAQLQANTQAKPPQS